MIIRRAMSEDAPLLTKLRERSMGHWGHSREWSEINLGKVRIPAESLYSNEYIFILVKADLPLGFYKFFHSKTENSTELVDLYVDIGHLLQGCGTRLWDDAVTRSRKLGAQRMIIISDPNASEFYVKKRAVPAGEKSSPLSPDCMLPKFEFNL